MRRFGSLLVARRAQFEILEEGFGSPSTGEVRRSPRCGRRPRERSVPRTIAQAALERLERQSYFSARTQDTNRRA
jgi:hypothetical protein